MGLKKLMIMDRFHATFGTNYYFPRGFFFFFYFSREKNYFTRVTLNFLKEGANSKYNKNVTENLTNRAGLFLLLPVLKNLSLSIIVSAVGFFFQHYLKCATKYFEVKIQVLQIKSDLNFAMLCCYVSLYVD